MRDLVLQIFINVRHISCPGAPEQNGVVFSSPYKIDRIASSSLVPQRSSFLAALESGRGSIPENSRKKQAGLERGNWPMLTPRPKRGGSGGEEGYNNVASAMFRFATSGNFTPLVRTLA